MLNRKTVIRWLRAESALSRKREDGKGWVSPALFFDKAIKILENFDKANLPAPWMDEEKPIGDRDARFEELDNRIDALRRDLETIEAVLRDCDARIERVRKHRPNHYTSALKSVRSYQSTMTERIRACESKLGIAHPSAGAAKEQARLDLG